MRPSTRHMMAPVALANSLGFDHNHWNSDQTQTTIQPRQTRRPGACLRATLGTSRKGGWDDMNRRMTIRQPFDLALSLEMGQAFRWRRVGDEGVRQRD